MSQTIHCDVKNCKHNESNCQCSLEDVKISCDCTNCTCCESFEDFD